MRESVIAELVDHNPDVPRSIINEFAKDNSDLIQTLQIYKSYEHSTTIHTMEVPSTNHTTYHPRSHSDAHHRPVSMATEQGTSSLAYVAVILVVFVLITLHLQRHPRSR